MLKKDMNKHLKGFSKDLRDKATKIEALSFKEPKIICFDFKDLRDPEKVKTKLKKVEGISGLHSIYIISLKKGTSAEKILARFKKAKESPEYSLPKENYKEDDSQLSKVLYVGKSQKTFSRLCQHLVKSTSRTYALYLGNWATDIKGGIQIDVFECDNYRQEIEDYIASELKPLLGRRGAA